MQWRDTPQRFGAVSIANHWLIAALMIGLLAMGFLVADMPRGPEKSNLIGLHKSLGLLVLTLAIVRAAWRLGNALPAPLGTPAPMLALAARALQTGLLVLSLLLPASGWLMSSAAGRDAAFFGLFVLPPLVTKNDSLREIVHGTHEVLAWLLVAFLLIHVGSTLRHHLIERDGTLWRMLGRSGVA